MFIHPPKQSLVEDSLALAWFRKKPSEAAGLTKIVRGGANVVPAASAAVASVLLTIH